MLGGGGVVALGEGVGELTGCDGVPQGWSGEHWDIT